MSVATEAFELIEKDSRVYALDPHGVEIVGARRPYGHDHWTIHPTMLVTGAPQHVFALSKEAATEWVRIIAYLYMRGVSAS